MSTPELSGAVWRKSSYSGGDEGECVEVAAVWRKSSHSGANEDACVEVTSVWRKSTHSGGDEGSCVEVARADRLIVVRDSKGTSGPVLGFAPDEWHALVADIKSDSLDLA
jgi:Domain of unknown function (DUF397)